MHALSRWFAGCALGLAGFGVLAVAYPRDPLRRWDADVARWVATDLPRWVEWLARPFTWIGGGIGLAIVVVVAAAHLMRLRARSDAVFVIVAVVGIQLLVPILKAVFDRPRPDVDPVVRLPSSASFPSGHAAGAVVCFGAVAVVACDAGLAGRRVLVGGAVVMALAIGLSRVALGVHYVSDVVAGWFLGAAWLAGCVIGRRLDGAQR
jgi:undecaprenyl-diphosphatase